MASGYWGRRITRRHAITSAAALASGAVTLGVVGCGGDSDGVDSDGNGLIAKRANTSSKAAPGGVYASFATSEPANQLAYAVSGRVYPTLLKYKAGVIDVAPGEIEGALDSWEVSPETSPSKASGSGPLLDTRWSPRDETAGKLRRRSDQGRAHARNDTARAGLRSGQGASLDVAGLHNDANTGKLSLTLDLSKKKAREIVKRLVAVSDVVTNNFRPGVMDRLGFGYEALKAIKPDIILLHMPGVGRSGPWAKLGTLGNI